MAQLKELRARTGAGVLDCKEAISAAGGDLAKAERWLLDKARGRFLKKAERPTTEGTLALATRPDLDTALLFEVPPFALLSAPPPAEEEHSPLSGGTKRRALPG